VFTGWQSDERVCNCSACHRDMVKVAEPAHHCNVAKAVKGGCRCLLIIGDSGTMGVANKVGGHAMEEEAHHWGDGECNHLILGCTVWHKRSEHQLEE